MRRFIIPLGVLAVATYYFYGLEYAISTTLICTVLAAIIAVINKLKKHTR